MGVTLPEFWKIGSSQEIRKVVQQGEIQRLGQRFGDEEGLVETVEKSRKLHGKVGRLQKLGGDDKRRKIYFMTYCDLVKPFLGQMFKICRQTILISKNLSFGYTKIWLESDMTDSTKQLCSGIWVHRLSHFCVHAIKSVNSKNC